ncbi:MAG: deoxynucleoside kinase [Candidatus Babeliaceae bacterium]
MVAVHKSHTPLIPLEGNIGAGKSTFLKLIGNYLHAQLVFEPHQQWQNINGENILQNFYNDMPRWAYTFQSYAFVTRIVSQQKQAALNTLPLQFAERSVYADRYCFAQNCFELGLMTLLEWNLYKEWFSWLVHTYTQYPSGFIYLRTDPDTCYKRLLKRNRAEEKNITLDYLKLLHNKHEDWLIHKKGLELDFAQIPVLVLDCNEDFEYDQAVQKKHMEQIADFCAQTCYLAVDKIKVTSPHI